MCWQSNKASKIKPSILVWDFKRKAMYVFFLNSQENESCRAALGGLVQGSTTTTSFAEFFFGKLLPGQLFWQQTLPSEHRVRPSGLPVSPTLVERLMAFLNHWDNFSSSLDIREDLYHFSTRAAPGIDEFSLPLWPLQSDGIDRQTDLLLAPAVYISVAAWTQYVFIINPIQVDAANCCPDRRFLIR